MGGGDGASRTVLDVDSPHVAVVGRMADHDDIPATVSQCRDQLITPRPGGGDHAVEEPLRHERGKEGLLSLLAVEREDREDRAGLLAALPDAVHEGRVVRIAEEFDDVGRHQEPDQAGPVRDESAGGLVREIARLLDHGLDTRPDVGSHIRVVVEHPGDRRPRDPGQLADGLERQRSWCVHHVILVSAVRSAAESLRH